MLRRLSPVIFFVVLSINLFAQDKIVLRNGDIIIGKVSEIGSHEIKYTTNGEPGSVVFLVAKKKTKKIILGSGEEVLTGSETTYQTSADLQNNIITLSPLKAIDLGMGYGISYERQLGDKKIVSLVLPFTVIFPENYDYYYSHNSDRKNFGYYFSPGIKIYPFGQKKVRYAMGTNFVLGHTYFWDYEYDNSKYSYYIDHKKAKTRVGLSINNSIDFQITRHFQIGINAGIGRIFHTKYKFFSGDANYIKDAYDYDDNFMGEMAFNFAYRF